MNTRNGSPFDTLVYLLGRVLSGLLYAFGTGGLFEAGLPERVLVSHLSTTSIAAVLGTAASTVLYAIRVEQHRERRAAQARLQEQEEWLRSITENVSEGIFRGSPEQGLVYANQAFAHLFDPLLHRELVDLYASSPDRKASHQSATGGGATGSRSNFSATMARPSRAW